MVILAEIGKDYIITVRGIFWKFINLKYFIPVLCGRGKKAEIYRYTGIARCEKWTRVSKFRFSVIRIERLK